jgi:hypothetical protein
MDARAASNGLNEISSALGWAHDDDTADLPACSWAATIIDQFRDRCAFVRR